MLKNLRYRLYSQDKYKYTKGKELVQEIINFYKFESNVFFYTSDFFHISRRITNTTNLIHYAKKLDVDIHLIHIVSEALYEEATFNTSSIEFERVVNEFLNEYEGNSPKEKYDKYAKEIQKVYTNHVKNLLDMKYKYNKNFRDFVQYHSYEKVLESLYTQFISNLKGNFKLKPVKDVLNPLCDYFIDEWEEYMPTHLEALRTSFNSVIYSLFSNICIKEFIDVNKQKYDYQEIYTSLTFDTNNIDLKLLNDLLEFSGLLNRCKFEHLNNKVYFKYIADINNLEESKKIIDYLNYKLNLDIELKNQNEIYIQIH